VAANRIIGADTAELLGSIFLEIIIAPDFTPEALDILTKKKNIRLLKLGELTAAAERKPEWVVTSVDGGMLVQESDVHSITEADLKVVTNRKPSEEEMKQLLFGWKVVKHVKSNAILLAKDDMTVGVGAGQMNRVGAARIAIEQANEKAAGSVLASDAFFPMGDTVELAAKAGITAIIQPGGSIKDEESIAAANANNIAMVFTGVRHFKH
jgi:phosphoribosylaminoimidazolecarboxamide formyltransferase/IMP cyclohydrolase